MALHGHIQVLLRGVDDWNNWRRDNPEVRPDLSRLGLRSGEIRDKLIVNGTPDPVTRQPVPCIAEIDFSNTILTSSNLAGIKFLSCNFIGADLSHSDMSNSHFVNCSFSEAFLSDRTEFPVSAIVCVFHQARALGTVFEKCGMSFVDLSVMSCDEKTRFDQVLIADGKISRQVLDDLRDRGGLTVGQLRLMKVTDDIGTLRRSFTGLPGFVQNLAVVLFLVPYVWFLANQWVLARVGEVATDGVPSSPIVLNLMRFIFSGGATWRTWSLNWMPFVMFLIGLIYNAVRLVLMLKTAELVHTRSVTGFDPAFRLDGCWKVFAGLYEKLSWYAVIVVFLHSLWFLFSKVPL